MRLKLTIVLVLGIAVAVAFAVWRIETGGTSEQSVSQAPGSYYLALGDSIAYGFQPTKADAPPSVVTGYVGLFAARLRKLAPHIQVVNYGCPGESAVTFVRGGCDWLKHGGKLHDAFSGSQQKAALSFLRAHPGEVSPITLTMWGNDVPLPLSQNFKDAPVAIASFGRRFSAIVKQLRAAAPTAEIIVTGAWNLEADRLQQARPLYRSVDSVIRRAAAASDARVVNMFAVFNGPGSVRVQQELLCRLSFICSIGDPHPTDAGYRAMASAFFAASGYSRN